MRISETWERAGDVGASTLDAARSASDRVRSTAADQLVRAGRVVEPGRSQRSWVWRLAVVPVVVAVAVAAALGVKRSRSGNAGAEAEDGSGEAADRSATSNGADEAQDRRTAVS